MHEEETTELENIVLGEPDSALFQPLAGYSVRDLERERREREQSQIVVTRPESFAGPWETADAKSGVIDGIFLWANTEVRQGAEYMTSLQIKVYRREGKETKHGWFVAAEGKGAAWDGKRLQLKFQPMVAGESALDIDVTFDPAQQSWTGSFSRDGAAKQVRLQRPGAVVPSANRFAADWFMHKEAVSRVFYSAAAIHVVEEPDGTLIAWQDTKGGRVINGPTHNEYGRELAVEDLKFDSIRFGPPSFMAMNNRVTFAGTLSADGSQMEGRWATNGYPSADSLVFLKSSGEGFSAAVSPH